MIALVSRPNSQARPNSPLAAAQASRGRPRKRTTPIAAAISSAASESPIDSGISDVANPTRGGASRKHTPMAIASARTQRRRAASASAAVSTVQATNASSA